MNNLFEAALKYVRYGWHVFPLVPRGKKPLTAHGLKDASTSEAMIKTWWSRWPEANIGIATGASGLVVIDLDGDEGIVAWSLGKQAHPDMDDNTLTSLTGGGGIHLIYQAPEDELRNSVSALAPHIDVRGVGGYIVVPPSIHSSGKEYTWDRHCHKEPQPLPPPILSALRRQAARRAKVVLGEIPERERNSTLASLGGTMRRRGMSETAIYVALLVTNAERCNPPLPGTEVQRIAVNCARYQPAQRSN